MPSIHEQAHTRMCCVLKVINRTDLELLKQLTTYVNVISLKHVATDQSLDFMDLLCCCDSCQKYPPFTDVSFDNI